MGASAKTRASPVEGYMMEVTRLPEKATFIADLDDDIAEGLRISLEEEDGNLIEVQTPESGTAVNFMSRLEKAIGDGHLNLDVSYDEEESQLKISHREYGLTKGSPSPVSRMVHSRMRSVSPNSTGIGHRRQTRW